MKKVYCIKMKMAITGTGNAERYHGKSLVYNGVMRRKLKCLSDSATTGV